MTLYYYHLWTTSDVLNNYSQMSKCNLCTYSDYIVLQLYIWVLIYIYVSIFILDSKSYLWKVGTLPPRQFELPVDYNLRFSRLFMLIATHKEQSKLWILVDFMNRFETSVRNADDPVKLWGTLTRNSWSKATIDHEDRNGHALGVLMASTGQTVCNNDN